ncbi:MAG: hypothetical protein WC360_00775 [Opitutales bacterium]|jgi:hypothetical protein
MDKALCEGTGPPPIREPLPPGRALPACGSLAFVAACVVALVLSVKEHLRPLARFVKDFGSNHVPKVFQALISFFFQGFQKPSRNLRNTRAKHQPVADVTDNQHFEKNVKLLS